MSYKVQVHMSINMVYIFIYIILWTVYAELYLYLSRGFLEHDPLLYVPALISDLTTKRVITTELVNGKPIDKVSDQISQDKRNEVELMAVLCLFI